MTETNTTKTLQDELHELFDELVPFEGKADTVAGEIVRAVCRIQYRFFNDGDNIGVGYGNETCNAAARYLMDNANSKIEQIIVGMWGAYNEYNYEKKLKDLVEETVLFIAENPELKEQKNDKNMFEYTEEEDFDWAYEEDEDYYEEDEDGWW